MKLLISDCDHVCILEIDDYFSAIPVIIMGSKPGKSQDKIGHLNTVLNCDNVKARREQHSAPPKTRYI
jgi:hypothetical protein